MILLQVRHLFFYLKKVKVLLHLEAESILLRCIIHATNHDPLINVPMQGESVDLSICHSFRYYDRCNICPI